jgi:hypothetical protein
VKEQKKMAKKNDNGEVVGNTRVVWHLSNDGLKPTQTPFGFIARNPLQFVVPPGQKLRVDLRVQANLPMLAFPARAHADDVTVESLILQPGTNVTCTVENKSQHSPLVVDDKEGLVALYPMAFDGVGEVG